MIFANEIQIEIDDVYACPGSCKGCVLTSAERKAVAPDMPPVIREKIFLLLNEYIKRLSGLTKINLTYGIADHGLMDDDYLSKIFMDGENLINNFNVFFNTKEVNTVFMSFSLIGKEDIILNKLINLKKISEGKNVLLLPIVVLDPEKLEHHKFGNIYYNNIVNAKRIFGKIDLSLNLSKAAVNILTPQALFDFAKEHQFSEVTINWIPTKDNLDLIFDKDGFIDRLANWLIDFAKLINAQIGVGKIECSYDPVIKKTFDAVMCKKNGSINDVILLDALNQTIDETIIKSLQFDYNGNVFPKLEAIGDVPHNERTGLKPWGNVMEIDNLYDFINEKVMYTKKVIVKSLSSNICMSCDYYAVCAASGFHIYNNVIKNDGVNCSHIGKKIFDYYFYDLLKDK